MVQLFRTTVQTINRLDYTPAQIQAWVGTDDVTTREKWRQSLAAHVSWVAESNGQLVGFADMAADGYLDRLYVHADYQGMGIASQLVAQLEAQVAAPCYVTLASITARPFFEQRGYRCVRANQVERGAWFYVILKCTRTPANNYKNGPDAVSKRLVHFGHQNVTVK